jgi:hypothetical protein
MEVDSVAQSTQAMAEVLKMAVEQSTQLADKLIAMSVQNTIDVVKDEMIGQAIDILV